MRKIINTLSEALGAPVIEPPPDQNTIGSRRRETDTKIVSALSRGNVRLQQGQFSTAEDLELERERVLAREI